ncbi:unnamed protein product [Closterium sp. NIES-54]
MELNPLSGHTRRLQSLLGPGAGDWLHAVLLISSLRLGPSHFSTAASFRLGLPLPVPRRCNCRYRTTFPDDRLPNHLMRCKKGEGRIATHHALQDECAKIAAEAGFTEHKETTAYSPVENLKADISIRHPDTSEVWICDITVTDPVSHQDDQARKAPGWAARMQADKKESKYAGRSAWVGFYAMAVETYGYPSLGVLDFLRSCAELAGKRWFNAAPKSREVPKLLTEYRQRWSVTLQRAQANALRDKTHEALTEDVLGLRGLFTPLSEGQLDLRTQFIHLLFPLFPCLLPPAPLSPLPPPLLSLPVSHDYYCNLDSTGRRTDWQQRPELSRGSVEFIAPVEYMVRPPMPPTFFFLIDASVNNARSGVLQVISDAIRACLDTLPGDTRTRIGFLLFDSALHFVSLKPSLTQPHILVSADIDDPYLPLPEDELLVNMHESRPVVEAFLDALPNLFANSVNMESAMGPALKAMALLVSQLGGKVLLFQSTMPSLGAGRLRLRGDDPRLYGTDREHTVRCSEDAFYKTTAAEFSRAQICVDTFVFSSKYCDLASLGTLARYTGGQVYHSSGFHLANDGDKLRSQIVRNLTRETAWESVMRIRCSKGLKIATFHGHFFIRSSDLLAIPAADADKGYAVQISHEEAVLANQTTAYLQCALLYTSSCGERRIRVHTLAVPIVRDMAELYRRCDVGATAAVLAKIALDKSLTSRLEECRQLIQNKTTLALREYRILTAGSAALSRTSGYGMPPGPPTNPYGHPSHLHQPNLPQQRLVFPESLRLLPLYTLALCKCPALRGGFQEMGADARAAAAFEMMVVSVGRTLRMLYPRLIRVDVMAGQCGVQDAAGLITLPRALPLATSSLDPQGAFLLDDSTGLTLWLGGALPTGTAAQIVGQDALNAPDISLVRQIPKLYEVPDVSLIRQIPDKAMVPD